MKIISKRGRKTPPPTADGIWPFSGRDYPSDAGFGDISDEEPELSGEDEEVLRKTVPDWDWDQEYLDFYE